MKILFSSIIAITAISIFVFASNSKPAVFTKNKITKIFVDKKVDIEKHANVKTYANKLKSFVKKNEYCEEYCFFIDMKIPSGKKRFFVYDLKQDTIVHAGLVTHGGGSETSTDALKFNNTPNSNSTSLGKYKIGVEYNGKFGMAFKLHGLEASNDKAFERFVVLHSHSCVPAQEVEPYTICTSLGCPTVSPAFLPTLKKYIDKADKPVVLWIYY
jgi:L,D-transpeptidase catalytic domain